MVLLKNASNSIKLYAINLLVTAQKAWGTDCPYSTVAMLLS